MKLFLVFSLYFCASGFGQNLDGNWLFERTGDGISSEHRAFILVVAGGEVGVPTRTDDNPSIMGLSTDRAYSGIRYRVLGDTLSVASTDINQNDQNFAIEQLTEGTLAIKRPNRCSNPSCTRCGGHLYFTKISDEKLEELRPGIKAADVRDRMARE